MWYYNGQIIKTPKTMTIGDLQYNKEVFHNPEKLKELGIKPFRRVMPDLTVIDISVSIDTSQLSLIANIS